MAAELLQELADDAPHPHAQLRVLLLPDVDEETEDTDWEVLDPQIQILHDDIVTWADQVREQIKGMTVDLPEGCRGRLKEKWRPLKRVAVAAGGSWPEIVDSLAAADVAERNAEKEAGLKTLPPSVVLMTDLHAVWPEGQEFVSSETLVGKLILHNPNYWGASSSYGKALTAKRLGILVSKSANITSSRPGGRGPHGYARSAFDLVWHRLGIAPIEVGASRSPSASGAETEESGEETAGCTASTACTDPYEGVGDPVTDGGQNPPTGDENPSSKHPKGSDTPPAQNGQAASPVGSTTFGWRHGQCDRCPEDSQPACVKLDEAHTGELWCLDHVKGESHTDEQSSSLRLRERLLGQGHPTVPEGRGR